MSAPTLTLSVGDGVSFALTPSASGDDAGSVNFQQEKSDIVVLNLKSFTGILRVSGGIIGSNTTSTTTSALKRARENEHFSPEASKKIREALESDDSDGNDKDDDEEDAATNIVMHQEVESPMKETMLERHNTNSSSPSQSTLIEASSQATLLGQPGLSQTQMDLSQPDDDGDLSQVMDDDEDNADDDARTNLSPQQTTHDEAKEPKKVEESPVPEKNSKEEEVVKEDNEVTEEDNFESETQDVVGDSFATENKNESPVVKASAEATKPARISLAPSPTSPSSSKVHDPPCARWGHTMTYIGKDRVLIYGGQTIDPQTKLPVTLKDVYLYDLSKKKFFKPFSGDGMPRQWHTATYLPDRQLLISFGGEALNPKTGKAKTENQVMVLDAEIMLWYPPAVTGDVPSARSGHTATVVGNDLVVFGGVKGSKWLNTVSVLDVTLWKWSSAKVTGAAPQPRSYHSAVAVNDRIVVFGGNNAEKAFDTVHVLEKVDDTKWKWSHPTVTGYKPKARTGHSATLLKDGKTICIYGGWDPNDDEIGGDDEEMIFEDSFLLDTEKWTWHPNKPVHGKEAKRVGHTAVLRGEEVFVFGGRVPGDTFTGDFQVVSVSKK